MLNQISPRPAAGDFCRVCSAKTCGFCGAFDRDTLAEFSSHAHRVHFRRDAEIAGQGEASEQIGVIASGLVRIVNVTESGDEFILQVLHRGQLVGAPLQAVSEFSYEAATDATICWVPRGAWEAFLQDRPLHFQAYVATMASQMQDLQRGVVRLRGRDTAQRVAFWLLEQAPNAHGGDRARIRIALSRRDLASLLDMTAETLCRALHRLHKRHVLRLVSPDLVEIDDLAKLRRAAKCQEEAVSAALAQTDAPTPRTQWNATAADRLNGTKPVEMPKRPAARRPGTKAAPDRAGVRSA